MKMNVKLAPATPTPHYAKQDDAGFDLFLNITEPVTVQPGQTTKVSCGIAMEIPQNHFGMVIPRSSLSKPSLMLANTIGIVDSGYRGDIMAAVRNIGSAPEVLNPGDRLFQMVIIPFVQVSFNPVEELSETDRGQGGFGSTNTLTAA